MDRRPSGKAAVLSFPETERLSSANLMAVPMYLQHGFTSICTASALAETGALRYMMEHERWSLRSLCEGLKLQPGYTKSCVHLLVSLDLLVDEGGGGYRRGRDFDDFVRLPFESIEKYLTYDFAKVFDQNVNAFFAQIDLTGPKLPRIQLLLESFYLAPIVIYLRMYVQGTSEAFKTTHLRLDESSLGPSVLAIFQGLGWCADNTPKLTYMGTYVLSTALNAGVPISYYPMFQELPKILMGDGSIFAAQEADGHEVHVDRVLNVIASGAQHKRFFEHIDVFADDAADSSLRGAVAAELLNFLLCYARALSANVNEICGVVRAARFKTSPKIGDGSFEDYVFTDNGAHDPALALHAAAGAKVQAVVDNWWPEDGDNGGRGAYATYVVGAPPSNRSKLP